MPWVRIEESLPRHPKVHSLSHEAFRLHMTAICWASEQLTNGLVNENDLTHLWPFKGRGRPNAAKVVAELVLARLWDSILGEPLPEEVQETYNERALNGALNVQWWYIHDYIKYNTSRKQVLATREANSARQKALRARREEPRNGVTNAVRNGRVAQPHTHTHTEEGTTPLVGTPLPGGGTSAPAGKVSRAAARTEKGTRIPNPFIVTEEMKDWFRDNVRNVDGPRETEKFINYWMSTTGEKGVKQRWDLVWQNWMRRCEERGQGGKPQLTKVSTTDQRVSATLARAEQLRKEGR